MHVKEEFGWSIAERQHSPVVVAFLRSVQGKDISEDEFAQKYAALSRAGKLHASRTRSPSKARGIYRGLKTKFDFFSDGMSLRSVVLDASNGEKMPELQG